MQLTKNISLSELTASNIAERKGIKNQPNDVQLINLRRLSKTLQEVRDLFNAPLIISSGFRCKQLNDAVGSKDSSFHIKGCACDFTISGWRDKIRETVIKIKDSPIVFDQLICEYDSLVHLSITNVAMDKPRRNVLTINKSGTSFFS